MKKKKKIPDLNFNINGIEIVIAQWKNVLFIYQKYKLIYKLICKPLIYTYCKHDLMLSFALKQEFSTETFSGFSDFSR